MKTLVLLCLAALALGDDDVYQSHYHDHDGHPGVPLPPIPCHGKPGCPGYPGKQETIDASGTRGSYYVEEPLSSIYVSYDHPRKGHH
ncbi:hypothetical protein FJT64_021079 [Amphibalanus amphitrite]|uniref:Uncharacterized protein n=1 Tax=Amphibalanus amphitrite TaxID=1232801 RepID=A0A6A4VTN0_AMPAM|nr:hypothetical protein FJT64_007421 [Amphibalanus amphitrite]KAF0307617.1 hypothetical protein FJT64_021079 [Amphibalanus amphitrite]